MDRIRQRLLEAFNTLETIDLRRQATGDPGIGTAIESSILERELSDLEQSLAAEPGPLARWLSLPAGSGSGSPNQLA